MVAQSTATNSSNSTMLAQAPMCQENLQNHQREIGDHYEEPYESFHAFYELGAELGTGAFGAVYKAVNAQGNSFAVKVVPEDLYSHEEIEILEDLKDCPHIVQVTDVFHEPEESYIVMEEMKGGDLYERLATKECYSEQEAKVVMRTMLEAIQFCNERGIAHCDIKLENILLKTKGDDTTVKLADFGLAKRFQQDGTSEPMLDRNGTAEYAAPEVFNRSEDDEEGYDKKCDIWSCGVVLYVLLGGYAPFEADNAEEMMQVVAEGTFAFHKKYWKHISREAKMLISQMMQVDPNKRCSLEEALASPWLN